jgi:hypothetical protein
METSNDILRNKMILLILMTINPDIASKRTTAYEKIYTIPVIIFQFRQFFLYPGNNGKWNRQVC